VLAGYTVIALAMFFSSLAGGAGELALIGFFSMMPWVFTGCLMMATT
jgi:hypothetical protein